MKKQVGFVLLLALLLGAPAAYGHLPRIVSEQTTVVRSPEISQAFYGMLTGQPHRFIVQTEQPFNLYAGILVPVTASASKDFSVHIRQVAGMDHTDHALDVTLDGSSHRWTEFHEEFADDHYYRGPEFGATGSSRLPRGRAVGEGVYELTVSNPGNRDRYVLVVGCREEFSLPEIIHTIEVLPAIKTQFFDKPAYTAFLNRIGLYVVAPVVLLTVLAVVTVAFLWRRFNHGILRR